MDDLEELLRRNDDDPDFGADLDDENEIAEFIRANPIPPRTAPVASVSAKTQGPLNWDSIAMCIVCLGVESFLRRALGISHTDRPGAE